MPNRHRKRQRHGHGQDRDEEDHDDEREAGGAAAKEEVEATEQPIQVLSGSGRISTSGTAVQGHDSTKFMDELHHGDAIIITHPTTLMDETRIVTMVLSNVSISISSPFSSDLISTLAFRYVKAPKEKREVVVDEHAKRQKKARDEDAAFGTYGGELGTKFVYRERKRQGTGYLIKTEAMTTQRSRGELLDMRAGKKADRMCM
mmetsp:Transcript_35262/g.94413  ORF Transcript_35262/g.94413 Transcript_35262/m.94413 type:complete len:203 (-) Transcript_35262:324-932(-)